MRERAIHPASHHSEYINIHHNDISQNSSLVGPGGGILLTRGADNYRVTNNYVCGNFVAGDGAGIAHFGLSDNGLIADNKVLLNHSFAQPPGLGTNGGGILVSGQGERVMFEPQVPEVVEFVATAGSGNVRVLRNLIQGNNAGSGDGGGLALANLNGQDVLASTNQETWHRVDVLNNIIVNNVAGMTGGGISVKDGLKVSIVNNTVMNNDSTATAFNAFDGCTGGTFPTLSCPKPAGISAWAHSTSLIDTGGAVGTFSNPTMINNIVLGNRSQHWEVTGDPGIGALVIDPLPSDFGVYPPATGTLTASNSIFTTGSIAAGHVIDAGATNTEVDATIPTTNPTCDPIPAAGDGECAIVLNPYRNVPPDVAGVVQPDGTVYGFSEFPADAKIAFDEGGNAIDVHYGPLSPVGDYHLQTGNPTVNAALSAGATPSPSMYPARSPDIDREERPICVGGPEDCAYDIGADEVESANGGTTGGTDVLYFSTANNSAVTGVAGPYDRADIYQWDGASFSRFFDRSAAGLLGHADINALLVVDADTFYMSFLRNGGTVVPTLGSVDDSDIVLFD
ncbi:MAG: hypothetical protein GY949_14810, partial [Gammaproteobacteria bacterium]|nr:hypothetical protein [Gammaproteobacteria bacterium]